jgi:hypothetical protein
MFNNVVLDVFIGLIFIFLLYSLLATIIQEIFASRFGLRARMLQKALRRMLEDDNNTGQGNLTRFSIFSYWIDIVDNIIRFFRPLNSPNSLLSRFYSHPAIKYLGESKLFKKPSYLHSHNFSKTLIQLLRGEEYDGRNENESVLIKQALDTNSIQIDRETLRQLRMLFADARQDSYLFKVKLEDWFEETMERATGWYKKQTQVILIWIGFILAAAFNVDAIAITKILMKDKKAREQIVQLAATRVKDYGSLIDTIKSVTISRSDIIVRDSTSKVTHDTSTVDTTISITFRDKFLDSVRSNLQNDALEVQGILGLRGFAMKKDTVICTAVLRSLDSIIQTNPKNKAELVITRKEMYDECLENMGKGSPYQKSWALMIVGWIITALAISLGAPFWFDILNKVIKLRTTGNKPTNISPLDNPGNNNSVKTKDDKEIRG